MVTRVDQNVSSGTSNARAWGRHRPNWYDNYSDMGTLLLDGDRDISTDR
jgi:hypothetical protein